MVITVPLAKKDNEYIVSLTSYPKRIGTVHITIKSLLQQSFKADKVILWLSQEEFPNKEADLPQALMDLQKQGLTIGWCKNLKSYNKLLPSLQVYPDAVIITVDDDGIYAPNWLEILIDSYISNPHCIHCHRADKIAIQDGIVLPYIKWLNHDKLHDTKPSYLLFGAGVAGTLYPPHCFNENIFDVEKMLELCPANDDVWFWGNAVLNGIKTHFIANALKDPKHMEGTQEGGLWNTHNKFNDVTGKCIRAFLAAYPVAKEILLLEFYGEEEKAALENKNNQLAEEKAALKNENSQLVEENKKYKQQLSALQESQNKLKQELSQLKTASQKYAKELKNIKQGYSFRMGRVLTYIPRKIRELLK